MSEVKRYARMGELVEANPALLKLYPAMTVYVLGDDFDRVAAERDALQLRLTEIDQRNDELSGMLQHLVDHPFRFTTSYRERIAATLKGETAAPPASQPITEQFIEDHLGKLPEQLKGMIEARGGKFAIMIDEANAHYGWTFRKDANGMWVSGRKATDVEMHAARTHAHITNQQ